MNDLLYRELYIDINGKEIAFIHSLLRNHYVAKPLNQHLIHLPPNSLSNNLTVK